MSSSAQENIKRKGAGYLPSLLDLQLLDYTFTVLLTFKCIFILRFYLENSLRGIQL